jgi:hypothetical protein
MLRLKPSVCRVSPISFPSIHFLYPTPTSSLNSLFQHFHLLLLLAIRPAHFLHSLIIHHLLDHTPRLPVQIAQLAILGGYLARVNLGRRCHDVRPPFHLVGFVEVDADLFARGDGFERPR